ncbi:MAG: hypothetical protein R3220_11535, partial [Balneolaceae bacterium]|nr:hypothetical protein [Balneolaceae bacterium]
FDTPEGKQYLQERLDIDYDLMDGKELREMVPELDSDQMYTSKDKLHLNGILSLFESPIA